LSRVTPLGIFELTSTEEITQLDSHQGSSAAGRASADWRFAVIVTMIYSGWVGYVALHHECWRDEADVWLAARDMSPAQLFRWLGGAGTPGLWYFMVMPLAKAGLPYGSMLFLHVAIAIAFAALIALLSPFPRLFKVLIIFSYYFLYEFAVVARSYGLTVLLLMLIAIALTAPRRKMVVLGGLLFLLFNANAHGFFIAGSISLIVLIEAIRRREMSGATLIGGCIAALGGVIAFLQLLTPPGAPPPASKPQWTAFGDAFSQVFLPHVPAYLGFFLRHSHGLTAVAEAAFLAIRWCGALIALTILFRIRRSSMAVAMVSLSWAALLYIFVFKWYGGERHAGLLFALLIFGLWVSRWPWPKTESGSSSIFAPQAPLGLKVFAASLFVSCTTGALWSIQEIRWEYSGAKSAAAFIDSHHLAHFPIATNPGPQCESVFPYLPHSRFWIIGRQEYGTYVKWDKRWDQEYALSDAELIKRVREKFPRELHLLMLASKPLADPNGFGYELIYSESRRVFDDNAHDEDYFIYMPSDQRIGNRADSSTPAR